MSNFGEVMEKMIKKGRARSEKVFKRVITKQEK